MTDKMLGLTVRDRRSGFTGRVIGVVEWEHDSVNALIVQPKVNPDGSVPQSQYVPESAAEVLPEPYPDMIYKQ